MAHSAKHLPTVRLGAMLLLQKGNRILLGRRRSSFANGKYMFFGGHVEYRESVKECLAREIKEELGIRIAEKDMEPVHIVHVLTEYDAVWVLFRVTKWKGTPKNLEPEKCSGFQWFGMGRLPKNSAPQARETIRQLGKGRFFSEQRH